MLEKASEVVFKDRKGLKRLPVNGVKTFLRHFSEIEYNLEEVTDDEEGIDYKLNLTENIKFTIESNMPFVNVRQWYKTSTGEIFPTKSGVAIFIRDLKKVKANLTAFVSKHQ